MCFIICLGINFFDTRPDPRFQFSGIWRYVYVRVCFIVVLLYFISISLTLRQIQHVLMHVVPNGMKWKMKTEKKKEKNEMRRKCDGSWAIFNKSIAIAKVSAHFNQTICGRLMWRAFCACVYRWIFLLGPSIKRVHFASKVFISYFSHFSIFFHLLFCSFNALPQYQGQCQCQCHSVHPLKANLMV